MGRYSNIKVATFSKKVNITEMEPEFQFFDTTVTHREGNYVTVVSHEYYRPSYRTRFRRAGRKNNRNFNLKQQNDVGIELETNEIDFQAASTSSIVHFSDKQIESDIKQ